MGHEIMDLVFPAHGMGGGYLLAVGGGIGKPYRIIFDGRIFIEDPKFLFPGSSFIYLDRNRFWFGLDHCICPYLKQSGYHYEDEECVYGVFLFVGVERRKGKVMSVKCRVKSVK